MGTNSRRPLPLPAPPRAILLVPGLVCGVAGTGLLYDGATAARLIDLAIGAPLFALGLLAVGWPFVLAMANVSQFGRPRSARRRQRAGLSDSTAGECAQAERRSRPPGGVP